MPTPTTRRAPLDLGLLVVRLALAGVMIAHGVQKAFLNGLAGTQQGFTGMGAPLPELTAVLVVLLEIGGGVLLVAGLATRVVALLFGVTMVGAAVLVHLPNGFYAADGGWELVGLLAALCLALVLSGAGRFSVDSALVERRRAKRRRAQASGDQTAAPVEPARV
ncbi:DoxX family protein [Microlunatus lacustris]